MKYYMHVKKMLMRGIKYNETNPCVPITHLEEWNISGTLITFPFPPSAKLITLLNLMIPWPLFIVLANTYIFLNNMVLVGRNPQNAPTPTSAYSRLIFSKFSPAGKYG